MRLALGLLLSLPVNVALAATANLCDANPTLAVADGTVVATEYAGSSVGVGDGFGAMLGAATRLHLDSSGTGELALGLDSTSATCAQGPNDSIVIYIDSRVGGFNDTLGFTDNSDQGRAAVSGMGVDGARAALTFAPSFEADFAVVIQNDFTGLFELRAGAPHVFVKSLTAFAEPPCGREWIGLTLAELGTQPGADLRYVATLLNASNGFRSNEFQGVATAPAANIGIAAHALAAGDWNAFHAVGHVDLSAPVRLTFDSYAGTGFTPTPTCGQLSSEHWAITGLSDGPLAFGGTRTSGDYAIGLSPGGVSTGGLYAFIVSPGNRGFGFQPAGTDFAPGTMTLRLRNNTSITFTSADLSYAIWTRNDSTRSTALDLSWSVDGATFTPVTALRYESPLAADSTPVVFVKTTRTTTLSGLTLAPGADLFLRFTTGDAGGSGGRDELAIDDIVVIPQFVPTDYGDAPASYGSASHAVSPLFLGASIDAENANQPSASADGDDTAGSDDEDGVVLAPFRTGAMTSLGVTSSAAGFLSVWIDWDADGVFQAGEQVISGQAVAAGSFSLSVPVPSTASFGDTVMRVRVASVSPTSPIGPMSDGEVEDYAITITGCGDGTVNGGEACDPGSATPTACGCQTSCEFTPSSTPCNGAPSGSCDLQDACDGAGACVPLFLPSTTICRASAGPCDVSENCSGSSPTCPDDAFAMSGECRASAGPCDVAESCDGSGAACPADGFAASSVICRASAGVCDAAETCTGASAACPNDAFAPNGTACADSLACNGAELCLNGACTAGTAPTCNDGDACTMDFCAEPGGCANMRFPGCCLTVDDCDDLDSCTTDECPGAGQMCTHTPIAGCVDGGEDGGVDGGEDAGEDGGVDGGELDGGADAGMGGGTGGGGGSAAMGGGSGGGSGAMGGGAGGGGGDEMPGCGCNSVEPTSLLGLALLALTFRARRRRATD